MTDMLQTLASEKTIYARDPVLAVEDSQAAANVMSWPRIRREINNLGILRMWTQVTVKVIAQTIEGWQQLKMLEPTQIPNCYMEDCATPSGSLHVHIIHKGFVDLFYDFWIQKSHHFYGFWIQNFFCPFLQLLDPETVVFLRFLDPSNTAVSGSRNCKNGQIKFWMQKR